MQRPFYLFFYIFFSCTLSFLSLVLGGCTQKAESYVLRLGPEDLYKARIAKRVRLSSDKKSLVLEGRNFKAPYKGIIETDCIDPRDMGNATIGVPGDIESLTIETETEIPAGASVDLYYSFGNTFYTFSDWTEWEKAKVLNPVIEHPKGRYCRFRLVLSSPDKGKSPSLYEISVKAVYKGSVPFSRKLTTKRFKNEELITSQYCFGYEKQDNKDLALFVRQMGYDTLLSNAKSDLEKLLILNTAVAKTPNPDHSGWETDYPFDPREICQMKNGQMTIKGHCMSYAAVLINTLTAYGFYSRHWATNGFRDMDHEVVEVWVDSLRKWIYLDPSLSQIYLDPNTGEPLSIKEMHDIYTRFVLLPGENFHSVSMEELKTRVNARKPGRGMEAPIICIDSGWHYGKKIDPKLYDWGWLHGYMVCGYLRLTDRNNYVSQPEPWFREFGNGIFFNTFLHWVDEYTPPKTDSIQTYTGRERDLWWSLNQAAIKATRTDENTISLEFGNTQTFFRHYLVVVEGRPQEVVEDLPYIWDLHDGENDLTVFPVDEFGNKGIPSRLTIRVE